MTCPLCGEPMKKSSPKTSDELSDAVLPYHPKIKNKMDLKRCRDDLRIFGGWYTTLKEKGKFKYSENEILHKFLIPCLKELIKEGSTEFHPENWKKWPKEIYLKALDKIVKKFRYLVEPHGQLIYDRKKTATVHAKKFIQGSFLSIVSDNKEYGFARFHQPKQITPSQFEKLKDQHQVSDQERQLWWGGDKTHLYFYKLRTWIPFDKPRTVKVPHGIQTYGNRANLKESRYRRDRCMRCDRPPDYELLWAEGMARAWFCKTHLKEWVDDKKKFGEINAIKKVDNGKVGKKWKDNTNGNIKYSIRRILGLKESDAPPGPEIPGTQCKSPNEGFLSKWLLDRAKEIHKLGQIIWIPNYISWTGSSLFADNRLPNDLDTVFRDKEINPALLLKVNRIFQKYLGTQAHPIPEPFGPNWRHLPLWDLALVPTKELQILEINEPAFIQEFYESFGPLLEAVPRAGSKEVQKQAAHSIKQDKIKMNRFFLGMKPTRPAFPEERMTLDSLLKFFKPEDFPVLVEKKYDGQRLIIFKNGDKVRIFSDDGEELTSRFPQTIEAIKKLNVNQAILDSETEMWEGKKHLPRETIAGYSHSKSKPDDSNIVSNIFGLLYLDGKDLHHQPEAKRRELLEKTKFPQSTIDEPDLKYRLNLVPSKIAHNIQELKAFTEDLRYRPASEGVVVKKHNAIYYLDRLSRNGWFKLHNTAVMNAIVIEVIETKTHGVHNYRYGIDQQNFQIKPGDLAEVKGREWLEVGKTFSTEKKVSRGDIIEIEFETLNLIRDERTDTVKATAWIPRFMRVRTDRTTPDKLDDIVKRAQKNRILMKKTISPEGKTIYESSPDIKEIEYLTESEYLQYIKHFGLSNKDIQKYFRSSSFLESVEISSLTETEIREIEKADPGFTNALRKAQKKAKSLPKFWATLDNHLRGASQHKDFRVKMNSHLKGRTITDQPEGAIKVAAKTVEEGRKVCRETKFKFRPDMDPATHCVVVPKAREPLVWLCFNDTGMGQYAAVPPGSVGATKMEWGVFIQEDEGMAYPTVKKPYFEEYFLNMKHYKGRMVIRLIPVGTKWVKKPKAKLQWQTWFNLKDQTPYLLTRRGRLKKDYVPDGIHTTKSGLPPEWEKKIPIAMRWWGGSKKSRQEKLNRMDQAYNYLIQKGILKSKPLKKVKESKTARFIIRRHWWKGQLVVRGMPVQHWDLLIDSGKNYLDEWNLESDPLIKENLETGIAAFRKTCRNKTPKGQGFKKWMEFEGSIPPNHPEWGNPNKEIPAFMQILDRGTVNWIADTDLFSRFQFHGKALKGLVIIKREDPHSDIWILSTSSSPGEKLSSNCARSMT